MCLGLFTPLAVAEEFVIDLAPISISADTGEKPQSKVWGHAATWWAVLPSTSFADSNDDGPWVWRLELDETWTNVLQLSSNSGAKADVKAVGEVAHVLLYDRSDTELISIEYDGATDSYDFWSLRPSATSISLSRSETATIDIDSTSRMWLATEKRSDIIVYYSDFPYVSFSGPIVLEQGISSDDISVVTALPNGTIGVLWSNQNDKQFGFRVHEDGADPSVWLPDEVPAADTFGNGVADDHLNVAVGSDGTLFAAVKTSFNSSSHPRIAVLVRRLVGGGPNGTWENRSEPDEVYEIDESGTRGIILLNEDTGRVRVVYSADTSGAKIVYRESPTSPINFGSRRTLMSGSLNNATSTKMSWTDEVVILASDGSAAEGVLVMHDTGASTTTSTTPPTTTSTSIASTTSSTTTTTTSTTTTTAPCAAGDACDTGLPGVCAAGTSDCPGGMPVCVQDQQAASNDATCDGLDDDCDGVVDEDVACPPGEVCNSSTGQCAAQTSIVAEVIADAYTKETKPTDNFNTSELKADDDSRKHAYIKLDVRGVGTGVIQQILLHLTVGSSSSSKSDHGGVVHATACAWEEDTLTWESQPATGEALDEHAVPVINGEQVTFDMTGACTGDGPCCAVIRTPSSDSVRYDSREAGSPPWAELTVAGISTTTTTSASTSTTTSPSTSTTSTTVPTTTTTAPPTTTTTTLPTTTTSEPATTTTTTTTTFATTTTTTPPALTILDIRVATSSDDAEERVSNGSMYMDSSDLELVYDKEDQVVGMRFNAVTIPRGATITDAYVQFQVDDPTSVETSLMIWGEDADDAQTFSDLDHDISSRTKTTAFEVWSPAEWGSRGEAGSDQQTPGIASVIQEIVNRDFWSSGNSLVIIITGSGQRTAESYDGEPDGAPLLHVEYSVSP
jgi:hypothetical protein